MTAWGFESLGLASIAVRVAALLAAAITHAGGDDRDAVKTTADEYIHWVNGTGSST